MFHRAFLSCLMGLFIAASGSVAYGQPAVKLLVGYPAGGSADAAARAMTEPLREALGRSVIIDNRPGAGGMIAGQVLKNTAADDATVLLANDHMVSMIPLTMKLASYDPERDFVSLGQFAKFGLAFGVSGATGVKSLQEYVDRARSDRSLANVAIPAPGSSMQFVGYVLGKAAAIDLNTIAYKGAAPAVADMLGNQISAGITPVTDMVEHHRSGKLRVLAVTGASRSALLPDVPTFSELGFKGLDKENFLGFYAPARTSDQFVRRFTEALKSVLENPDVRERLLKLGFEPSYAVPKTFSDRVKADTVYWAAVVKESGFVPQ